MKIFASILIIYILALTALPSVRAIRVTMSNCPAAAQHHSTDNSDSEECPRGKFIMTLNFSPLQYFNHALPLESALSYRLMVVQNDRLVYTKVFIDQYYNQIWQPPKIIS
ncbi:MAG: hypothetical protein U0X58_07660 [Flavobacteriaceae bacterium]